MNDNQNRGGTGHPQGGQHQGDLRDVLRSRDLREGLNARCQDLHYAESSPRTGRSTCQHPQVRRQEGPESVDSMLQGRHRPRKRRQR